jgi:hypothetical protein
MHFFVITLTVFLDSLRQFLLVVLGLLLIHWLISVFLFFIELLFDSLVVTLADREDFTTPLPVKFALAVVRFLIKNTASTHLFTYD